MAHDHERYRWFSLLTARIPTLGRRDPVICSSAGVGSSVTVSERTVRTSCLQMTLSRNPRARPCWSMALRLKLSFARSPWHYVLILMNIRSPSSCVSPVLQTYIMRPPISLVNQVACLCSPYARLTVFRAHPKALCINFGRAGTQLRQAFDRPIRSKIAPGRQEASSTNYRNHARPPPNTPSLSPPASLPRPSLSQGSHDYLCFCPQV